MIDKDDIANLELKASLLGSLLTFTCFFYKQRTGKDFNISYPDGRESHQITICKALTKAFYGDITRLIINIPPGLGKSELIKHFVAWSMAHYPDSNFLYISYSQPLAASHTSDIKDMMRLPIYKKLFDVELSQDTSAKDHFKTTQGGVIYAAGSTGTITGFNAGSQVPDRFSGACLMDDMHKPDEVHSDARRGAVKSNFIDTILLRQRDPRVPFIFIGQRLHEDDLPGALLDKYDGFTWNRIILPSLDEHEKPLCPSVHPKESLLIAREKTPYVFAAQHQQDPLPSGGGLFKEIDFPLIPTPDNIITSFITCDTAETTNTHNDATAISLWGVHKIKQMGVELDLYGLHWLDCLQIWVEPRDLEAYFMDFYARNMQRSSVPISLAAIEKKSTGTTLYSLLRGLQGIKIIPIDRNANSGSKADRFIATQSYAASRYVSLPISGSHSQMCLEHMKKITANDTHSRDDIADTYVDAVMLMYKDKLILPYLQSPTQVQHSRALDTIANQMAKNMRILASR